MRIVKASDTRDLVANRTRAIFVHSAAASCPMSSLHFKLHASRSLRVDTETINCSHSARGIDTCSHVRTIHSITPIRSTRRALIVSSAPERFPSRTELTLHLWRERSSPRPHTAAHCASLNKQNVMSRARGRTRDYGSGTGREVSRDAANETRRELPGRSVCRVYRELSRKPP